MCENPPSQFWGKQCIIFSIWHMLNGCEYTGSSCEFPQEIFDRLSTILDYSDLYYGIQTVIK